MKFALQSPDGLPLVTRIWMPIGAFCSGRTGKWKGRRKESLCDVTKDDPTTMSTMWTWETSLAQKGREKIS